MTLRRTGHADEGTDPLVVVLKSHHYGAAEQRTGQLPYRIDRLRSAGFRLAWTDDHLDHAPTGRRARLVATTERLATPWMQAWRSRHLRARSAATLAIFESEGHALAAWRAVSRRRPPLVIVGCWLADLLADGASGRRRLYRFVYRGVDRIVVFSSNQVATLVEHLGVEPERIAVVRFGIDLDELAALPTTDSGRIVAAGRDAGRDWATLLDAVRGTGLGVDLITRQRQIDGLDVPPEVTVAGVIDRDAYLAHLASAAVVAVPTDVREYPTGQTVLLEAMALGKCCIVTDTPAMREYVTDGETAVLVAPHDTDGWRRTLTELMDDPARRARLGAAARRQAVEWGGAAAMWQDVAEVIGELVTRGG